MVDDNAESRPTRSDIDETAASRSLRRTQQRVSSATGYWIMMVSTAIGTFFLFVGGVYVATVTAAVVVDAFAGTSGDAKMAIVGAATAGLAAAFFAVSAARSYTALMRERRALEQILTLLAEAETLTSQADRADLFEEYLGDLLQWRHPRATKLSARGRGHDQR